MFNPEKFEPGRESEPEEKELAPKDVSQEFLTMSREDFNRFLRSQRNEKELLIKIDYRPDGAWDGVVLKAFLDDFDTRPLEGKQKRIAIIRATKEQREQYDHWQNVFSSGVKWEEVEEKE